MSEIAELISGLNASAQIAYTSFRTYFKSSARSSGGVRYRRTPIKGVRYLQSPIRLWGCTLSEVPRPPPKSRRSKDLQAAAPRPGEGAADVRAGGTAEMPFEEEDEEEEEEPESGDLLPAAAILLESGGSSNKSSSVSKDGSQI